MLAFIYIKRSQVRLLGHLVLMPPGNLAGEVFRGWMDGFKVHILYSNSSDLQLCIFYLNTLYFSPHWSLFESKALKKLW